jgi:mono/diheme cytochrome c family protein
MVFSQVAKEIVMRPIHHSLMSTIVPVIVVAGLMGLVFHSFACAQDYPADTTRGKAVYERHCQACHGVGGWGDGPDAQTLKVAPANFHRFMSFLKSDEELLRTIEHGVVFSPMHSWRGQLTDGEMQDVVSYVRLLSQQGR